MISKSVLEALYGQFCALRRDLNRKQLDRIAAQQTIERLDRDIHSLSEQRQEIIDFVLANGQDLEALDSERIALAREREYDPMGMS